MLLRLFLTTICLLGSFNAVQAAITSAGSVDPANPTSWNSSTNGIVGLTASGNITVDSGSDLFSNTGTVGFHPGSTSVATITGNGSTWTNSSGLTIGQYGNGVLYLTDGGNASNTYGSIGGQVGSTGAVYVLGNGSTWTNSSSLIIGYLGNGTLNIIGGGNVYDSSGSIGGLIGSTGVVTVEGTDSKWINTGQLNIGDGGNGTLNIRSGGRVSNSQQSYIGYQIGQTGVVAVDGSGSNWTNAGWIHIGQAGNGVLNITHGGTVSNTSGTIGYGGVSTGVVTVAGNGSKWTNNGSLLIGADGGGALNIGNGGVVSNTTGRIGQGSANSTGVVNVDGSGSKWTNTDWLYVGQSSPGTLSISRGGQVSNTQSTIGDQLGSTGVVTVDGSGSTWTNTSWLRVGQSGKGTLNIAHGGAVTALGVSINNQSLLTIDIGSSLNINNGVYNGPSGGSLINDGIVRISAAANAAQGTYLPILAGSWSGSGTYQALGGTWNTSTHQFTVSAAETGESGEIVVMALSAGPRVLFDDAGGTGWSVGASFAPTGDSGTLSFAATTISGSTLSALETLAGESQSVLGGWEFTASEGYTQGSPVYLTFDVGEGFSADGLQIWHNHEGSWSPYAVSDLTYDGRYASFTVTGFSGYAVTTVPEPGTMALLTAALLGLGLLWRTCRESK